MRCKPGYWVGPRLFRSVFDEVCELFRLRGKIYNANDYNDLLDEAPDNVAEFFRQQIT